MELDKVLDLSNRTEIQTLKMLKKLNGYDYERYQKGYLPTVAAALSGSYATQTKAVKELFTLPYFPTGAFVLSASVPIYDGNTRKAKMNQAKLNMLKNDNDLMAAQQGIELEVSNAFVQLRNSITSLENQKNNIELAQKSIPLHKQNIKKVSAQILKLFSLRLP